MAGVHKRKTLMARINPQADWINTQKDIDTAAIEAFLPEVVAAAEGELNRKKQLFNEKHAPIVQQKVAELDALRKKQLSLFEDSPAEGTLKNKDAKRKARKDTLKSALAKRGTMSQARMSLTPAPMCRWWPCLRASPGRRCSAHKRPAATC